MKNKIRTIITLLGICLLPLACTTTSTPGATGGVKPYPSDKCIVTDNTLGSMGTPITLIHEGQEVKFCCKPCVAKFQANPAKYLAKIR